MAGIKAAFDKAFGKKNKTKKKVKNVRPGQGRNGNSNKANNLPKSNKTFKPAPIAEKEKKKVQEEAAKRQQAKQTTPAVKTTGGVKNINIEKEIKNKINPYKGVFTGKDAKKTIAENKAKGTVVNPTRSNYISETSKRLQKQKENATSGAMGKISQAVAKSVLDDEYNLYKKKHPTGDDEKFYAYSEQFGAENNYGDWFVKYAKQKKEEAARQKTLSEPGRNIESKGNAIGNNKMVAEKKAKEDFQQVLKASGGDLKTAIKYIDDNALGVQGSKYLDALKKEAGNAYYKSQGELAKKSQDLRTVYEAQTGKEANPRSLEYQKWREKQLGAEQQKLKDTHKAMAEMTSTTATTNKALNAARTVGENIGGAYVGMVRVGDEIFGTHMADGGLDWLEEANMANKASATTKFGKTIGTDLLAQAGQLIGMAPLMQAGQLIGGAGKAAGAARAAATGLGYGFGSAGQELHNAYENGATKEDARQAAVLHGLMETAFGGISEARVFKNLGGEAAGKFIENRLRRVLREAGINAATEGGTEWLTSVSQNAASRAIYDNPDNKSLLKIIGEEITNPENLYAGALGGIMGGGMGAIGGIPNPNRNAGANNARVEQLTRQLSDRLGISVEEVQMASQNGTLHDMAALAEKNKKVNLLTDYVATELGISAEKVRQAAYSGTLQSMAAAYERNARAKTDSTNNEFMAGVRKAMRGELASSDILKVSNETPQILQQYGAENRVMTMSQNVVRKIAYPEGYMGGKHNLGFAALEQLPQQLEDPVAILKSATQKNSIVILTELVDAEGRPVIVPVHLDKKGNLEFSNEIPSMYGRENFADFIDRQEKAGNILYTKKDRNLRDLPGNGLQLSELGNQADPIFNNSIPQNGENINGVVMEQELDERQLQVYRDMLGIAEAKGGSIVVRNDLRRGNPGFIEYNVDGTDRFRIVVADEAMVDYVVAGHEFTHSLEGTPEYGDYMTFVKDYLQEKGVDIQAVKNEIYDEYAKFGQRLVDDGDEYEMMAMFTAKHLFNDDVVIRRLKVENPNVFQRIMEWLEDVIARLKGGEGAEFYIQARRKYLAASRAVSANPQGKGRQNLFVGVGEDVARRATAMETEGRTRQEIWEELGVNRTMDGKGWRGEIDDSGMEYLQGEQGSRPMKKSGVLSDFIKHDELFQKYPGIENVRVEFKDMDVRAEFNLETGTLTINEKYINAPQDLLVHEIQHAIQQKEGWPNGSNEEYFGDKIRANLTKQGREIFTGLTDEQKAQVRKYNELLSEYKETYVPGSEHSKALEKEVQQLYNKIISEEWGRKLFDIELSLRESKNTAREMYWNTAGEIEARDAKKRREMTPEERKKNQPQAADERTVFVDDGVSYSADMDFDEQVDLALSDKADFSTSHLNMGKTPDNLGEFGFDTSLPMLVTQKHIKNINAKKNTAQHKHGLTAGQIKSLPEKIADPVMVMVSKTKPDCLIVLTDILDEDKCPIIVSLQAYGKGMQNHKFVSANIMTSAYGRENFEYFIFETYTDNRVLIADKKKIDKLSVIPEVSFPRNIITGRFTNNINDFAAKVKSNREKSRQISQTPGVQFPDNLSISDFTHNIQDSAAKVKGNREQNNVKLRQESTKKNALGFDIDDIISRNKDGEAWSDITEKWQPAKKKIKLPEATVKEKAVHTPEQLKIIQEYENAVDKDLVDFAKKSMSVSSEYANKLSYPIKETTGREVADIKKAVGVDTSGYTHYIKGNTVRHTDNRHGENGIHNQSMADVYDYGRIGYVLDNYDSVEPLMKNGKPVLSREFRNSDNTYSPMIRYSKRIDGTVYVVEAVPDSNRKALQVVSVYIEKNRDPRSAENGISAPQPTSEPLHPLVSDRNPRGATDGTNAPQPTPEAFAHGDSNPSIPQKTENIKLHTPEQLKIMQEYKNSVDTDLVSFAQTAINDSHGGNRMRYLMHDVTFKESQDIKKIVGKDTSGYKHSIKGSTIVHINKRHGANGQQDQSMADINDIGRIEYVLKNYDNINLATDNKGKPKKSKWSKNKDGSYAEMVIYEKKIDGTMYVVEAVPDTKTKLLQIVSAYIKKRSNSGPEHAASSPQDTPKAPTAFAPNQSIPQKTENIKLHTLMEADTPAGEKAAKAWEEKITKKKQKIRHDDRMTLFESLINEREKAHGRLNAKERQTLWRQFTTYLDDLQEANGLQRNAPRPRNLPKWEKAGNRKITPEMSDAKRVEVLKGKTLQNVPTADPAKAAAAQTEHGSLEGVRKKTLARRILSKIGEQFGVFKDDYYNGDIDVEFGFSKSKLDESISKQKAGYKEYAELLSVLDEVVDGAVGIEAHKERYQNQDSNTDNVYVLLGAFQSGESIVPVRLTVKTYNDGTKSKLHVLTSMKAIKKAEVIKNTPSAKSGQSFPRSANEAEVMGQSLHLKKGEPYPRSANNEAEVFANTPSAKNGEPFPRSASEISIADLVRNVKDGDVLKYLPDGLLTKEQKVMKAAAMVKTEKYIQEKNRNRYGVEETRENRADIFGKNVLDNLIKNSQPDGGNILTRFKDRAVSAGHRLYADLVDSQNVVEQFAQVEKKFKGEKDVTSSERLNAVRNASGTVDYIFAGKLVDREGNELKFTDHTGRKVCKGFAELFLKDGKTLENAEMDALNQYMQHANNMDCLRNGRLYMDSDEEASGKYIRSIEAYYPWVRGMSEDIRNWYNAFMEEWAVGSGLMDKWSFDFLRQYNPNYVPGLRVDKQGMRKEAQKSGKGEEYHVGAATKKAEGSIKDIVPVQESFMVMVDSLVKRARKNEMVLGMFDSAGKHPELFATYLNVADYKAEQTISDYDSWYNGLTEYQRINAEEVKSGGNKITCFKDGYVWSGEASAEVIQALNLLGDNGDHHAILEVVKKAFTNPMKTLTTGVNPAFAVANIIRDTQDYFLFSKANGFRAVQNYVAAAYDMLMKSDIYKEYQAQGGRNAGRYHQHKGNVGAKKDVRNANKKVSPVKALVSLMEGLETLPRLAEYRNVIQGHGESTKNGAKRSSEVKKQASAAASDVTINFARHGKTTKMFDTFTLYLNASVQGIDKYCREIKRNPRKVLTRSAVLHSVPTVLLWALWHGVWDDDGEDNEYDKLSNRTKDTNYIIPNVFKGKDENGKYTEFIKIPKTRESSLVFSMLLERGLRLMNGEEEAFKGVGYTLSTNLPANPLVDNAFASIIQVKTNRDYAGRSIVPQSMADLSPVNQWDINTSKAAIAIGKVLNKTPFKNSLLASPKNIDYLIGQSTGILGDVLQNATSMQNSSWQEGALRMLTQPFADKFTANSAKNSQVLTDFYDDYDKIKRQAEDSRFEGDSEFDLKPPISRVESYYYRASADISQIYKWEKDMLAASDISAKEKKEYSKLFRARINELASGVDYKQVMAAAENLTNLTDKRLKELEGSKMWQSMDDDTRAAAKAQVYQAAYGEYVTAGGTQLSSDSETDSAKKLWSACKSSGKEFATYMGTKGIIKASGSQVDVEKVLAMQDKGVKLDTCIDYLAKTAGLHSDKGADGKSIVGMKQGGKMWKVAQVIAQMDISDSEKDLLFKQYSKTSYKQLSKTPWHTGKAAAFKAAEVVKPQNSKNLDWIEVIRSLGNRG